MYADAPYASRPYADVENIVGFADGFADISGTFRYAIYAATEAFATRPDDRVLANQPFRGTLELPLNFKWSILGGADIGTFTTGSGSTTLNNDDGEYDLLPSTFTADGRPIEIKAYRKGDDYGSAFTVFRGVMASWFIDESLVSIQIRDFGYKLSVPAQPNLYAGSGGLDGGDDLAGKRKPLVFGYVKGWSGVLLSGAYLTYQVHDGAIKAVTAVYDSGAALTATQDYPDYAALIAAPLTGGQYGTCLAIGVVRVGSKPAGQLTVDVQGDNAGGSFAATTADIIKRWVVRSSSLRAGDLYLQSFDALNVNQPAPVGYGVGPDDGHTVADVVADLMHGIGGWGGFRKNGQFEVRRFMVPTSSPMMLIEPIDIFTIKREPLPSSLTPPPFRQRVTYDRNWTVLNNFAGSVSAERVAYLSSQFRLAEASAASIQADHPFAQDPDVRACYFLNKADAEVEALRLLNLYRVERALYRITGPRKLLHQNLGDTVSVTFPRWDLSLGRNMRIVEITANPARQSGQVDTVEWVCYG